MPAPGKRGRAPGKGFPVGRSLAAELVWVKRNGATVQQDRRSRLVANRTMMSPALTETETSPSAPRAGADLRAARERLAWPIEDVAAALCIRQAHLEALEDGRIDLLPGAAYAVGFLRSYAKALGLDPNEIVRRFKAEAGEVNRRIELVFPAPMPERGVPAGAVILLGVVLAIGAYAGWYRLSGQGRLPAETVMPVPQRLASLAEQAVPPLPVRIASVPGSTAAPHGAGADAGARIAPPGGATEQTAVAGQPNSVAVPATAAAGGASGAQAPAGAAPAGPAAAVAVAALPGAPASPAGQQQLAALPVPAISPTSAAAASVPLPASGAAAPGQADAATAAPDPSQIVLRATADAWMQVRDRSGGGILLNRVLHSGDTWVVPERPNLVLTTGNAGGTEVMVDGTMVQVPGGSGAVRRDLPLDADQIKEGRLAQLAPAAVPPGNTGPTPKAGQSTGPHSADQQ